MITILLGFRDGASPVILIQFLTYIRFCLLFSLPKSILEEYCALSTKETSLFSIGNEERWYVPTTS